MKLRLKPSLEQRDDVCQASNCNKSVYRGVRYYKLNENGKIISELMDDHLCKQHITEIGRKARLKQIKLDKYYNV